LNFVKFFSQEFNECHKTVLLSDLKDHRIDIELQNGKIEIKGFFEGFL